MLQWSSNAGHYDIYIRDKQGRPVPEAPDIVGGATNENYHEFYGLKPDKEYFFSMRARSEGGTQGCVSKNTSETVSAKTDSAELNRICSNYEKTAHGKYPRDAAQGVPAPRQSLFRAIGQPARARISSPASSRGGQACRETPRPSGCAIRIFKRANEGE